MTQLATCDTASVRSRSAFAASLLLASCRGEPEQREAPQEQRRAAPTLRVRPVEVAARSGAASPRLTAGPGGVTLSWVEPDGEGLRLRARRWGGATETVVADARLLQNFADVPSVMATSSGWLAAWPQLREGGYDLQWARKGAAGPWAQQGPLSDATEGPEFGFVSWAASPEDAISVFWLDGRASTTSHGGAMQLHAATIGAAGVSDRRVVDDRVCDCCQTAAANTPRGPVVAYRDRGDDEVRDVWLAGPGEERRRLGADGWRIEGCPVNGPAVATHGDEIAVAWFSGATNPGHVRVAFAGGDGPFSVPVEVDDGAPIGRVDVVWLDPQSVAVTWLETVESGAEIRLRRVTKGGTRSEAAVLATTEAARRAGFPQLERVEGELVFAWVGLEGGASSIVAGTAPVDDVRSL